jgi:hemerythrin-like metal-binding protein
MTAQNSPDLPDSSALPDALRLGEPVTDATHAEFVLLLEAAARAGDNAFLAALDEWIDHTRYHFGQEEAWMDAMGFGPRHCHQAEHEQVLKVADAVRAKVADEGDFETGRRLVAEMSGWFDLHVKQKDALMVAYMREHGFTLVEAPATPAT